ncbi:MAG: efflux RND transporter permease subunit, partial [Muribaculaceae bacterium]|nr:efflux RND transporter permease subunit [Muribaculaceae bacterium]
ISANVYERDLKSTVNDIQKVIADEVKLPEGYIVKIGGQFESEAAASQTLMATSLLAILIIFMLLYGEFKSLSQSLLILVNMPLAIIGGILILVITDSELNIPAIIGFISLIGISTRNGMLLINRYNYLKREGVALSERIITGSVDRLTPILMTALTSALALIPLALKGGDAGNEIQAPMATVILGGLITSTILNVYIVPILYKYLESRKD